MRRGDDVRARRRDVLLADDAHPEHDLEHAQHDGAGELVEAHALRRPRPRDDLGDDVVGRDVAGVDHDGVGRGILRASRAARGCRRPVARGRARRGPSSTATVALGRDLVALTAARPLFVAAR